MDVAARYGGEEFVAVLPETDHEGAIAVAERIRGSIEGCGFAGEGDSRILVTVSVGVATYPSDARTAETLIEAADTAMYLAKRSGKNQVKSASTV
jgi:diguanylate cyclase (GGDEF)-like protein